LRSFLRDRGDEVLDVISAVAAMDPAQATTPPAPGTAIPNLGQMDFIELALATRDLRETNSGTLVTSAQLSRRRLRAVSKGLSQFFAKAPRGDAVIRAGRNARRVQPCAREII
jgi:hypothetical protein